jgi:hypothetical protein
MALNDRGQVNLIGLFFAGVFAIIIGSALASQQSALQSAGYAIIALGVLCAAAPIIRLIF